MFTGIIETTGIIREIITKGTNKSFWIDSPISDQFTIDQSVAHNGACLTVEAVKDATHLVTAVQETLQKTDLNTWRTGTSVNLERCLLPTGRLDGHIVQGHVDTTATLISSTDLGGSRELTFSFPETFAQLVIEKGSISINGTSLTIFNVSSSTFSVAIIPYTWDHTNFHSIAVGSQVNLEFDIIGKYISRWMDLRRK